MGDTDRQKRRREKMKAKGLVYYCCWVTPEQRDAIRQFVREGKPLPKQGK